jgi:hypothetical protein
MESSALPSEVILKPKAPPAAVLQAGMAAKLVVPFGSRQVTLFEDKITVHDPTGNSEALPRRYTLTHDDRTAELFLSIGADYDRQALDQPQVVRVRDEVLAELTAGSEPRLTVRCRVESPELQGKTADPGMRRRIFAKEMPFVRAITRYGDRCFFERNPHLDQARVMVEYEAASPEFQGTEDYGRVSDYRVTKITGESRRLIAGAAAVAAVGIGAMVVGKLRNR